MLKTIDAGVKNNFLPIGYLDRMQRHQLIKLLTMQHSTTKFLEELAGKKLKVNLEFQRELYTTPLQLEIVRVTRLYLDHPQYPVIYSITSLPKKDLKPKEIEDIKDGDIPLGRVFKLVERKGFRKSRITIQTIRDERMSKRLNVLGTWFFAKEYCLWVGNRRIGNIKEIFNEESFLRIWS
jgi:chorismate-pyruvate lyase